MCEFIHHGLVFCAKQTSTACSKPNFSPFTQTLIEVMIMLETSTTKPPPEDANV